MTGAPGQKNLRRCTQIREASEQGATSAYGKFLGEANITALASGFGLLEPDASRFNAEPVGNKDRVLGRLRCRSLATKKAGASLSGVCMRWIVGCFFTLAS